MESVRPWLMVISGTLSCGDAVDHGVGDADRERVPGRDARMALLPLVAFDAALDLVLGLAFVPGELDAVDAAVARC